MSEDQGRCVYFGYDRNGLFKIGRTDRDYQTRARQIQNMNPAFEILFLIETRDTRSLEAELHNRFSSKRVIGEWFRLTADEIQALVYEFKDVDVPIEEIERQWKYCVGQDLF